MISGKVKLAQLQPRALREYVQEIFRVLEQYGVSGTIYDVYRSPSEQERRFSLGDTKARAGQSPHQYGLAFDFVISDGERSARQRELQQLWQSLGFTIIDWDPAHVEVPNWRSWISS